MKNMNTTPEEIFNVNWKNYPEINTCETNA